METAVAKAMDEALKSDMSMRHGCVVCTKSGKIITAGHNSYRSRVDGENVPCCHAEVAAVRRLGCREKQRTSKVCNSRRQGDPRWVTA